jgi:hypothetical protein
MSDFSKKDALDVYWRASPAIRQVILNEARTNAQARQTAMIALEQRVAQASAALFAAAAFSATFALSFRDGDGPFSMLGGLATIAFVIGSLTSLWGTRAGDIVFAGTSPSWWRDCEFLSDDESLKADNWMAGHLEDVIKSYDDVAVRRARYLNMASAYAVAGGGLIGLAGFLAIFL